VRRRHRRGPDALTFHVDYDPAIHDFDCGNIAGPYRIEGMLGAGGMGEVYRAHDPRLGRSVAIKIVSDAVARDVNALARFEIGTQQVPHSRCGTSGAHARCSAHDGYARRVLTLSAHAGCTPDVRTQRVHLMCAPDVSTAPDVRTRRVHLMCAPDVSTAPDVRTERVHLS